MAHERLLYKVQSRQFIHRRQVDESKVFQFSHLSALGNQLLHAFFVQVNILNVNLLQVNLVNFVLKHVSQRSSTGFDVKVLKDQSFEALLVLYHEFGNKAQIPE